MKKNNSNEIPLYMKYWGKAKRDSDQSGETYHLLPYHCLDVAAVAEVWWNQSPSIRHAFTSGLELNTDQFKAWILFFIALHDYGKWDPRFQRKAPEAWQRVHPELAGTDLPLSEKQIRDYNHGLSGFAWLREDLADRFGGDDWLDEESDDWNLWSPWMAAVAGHHGAIPGDTETNALPLTCQNAATEFKKTRRTWLECLEQLFLIPAGLSLSTNPPQISAVSKNETTMLAGFCSVSDWLGSSDIFPYDSQPQATIQNLDCWYKNRFVYAERALDEAGVLSQVNSQPGINKLLNGYLPRQVQCIIDKLPVQQSLTLIESSTGSGKTEAALAYAWQLLEKGLADSIIFALPTQATANAMLDRLEEASTILFREKSNLVLAHGRAKYQQKFIDLKQVSELKTFQGKDEAWVQCGEWLAQSRKRIFLGQIGVCTIDQVLVSVLPIRHKFVRGFGIGRSVLIVDEVHAYDSYMYGLLGGVLQQQQAAGGSAILLSATLPFHQKKQLAKSWNSDLSDAVNQLYPLITHIVESDSHIYDLTNLPDQQPPTHQVCIELQESEDFNPDEKLTSRIMDAVEQGAQVCFVCNLVDVAQDLFQQFYSLFEQHPGLTANQVNLFHSRFTFTDRQLKEEWVLGTFGKIPSPDNARNTGHLLIATQVVEQSLDIDFDWLITHLCPVDLLFQRLGRLHRHDRSRPVGFKQKNCTILAPDSLDYQLHSLIYGNSRVLWRTHQLLKTNVTKEGHIQFPNAYRQWIEDVYREDPWDDEPESVLQSYEQFTIDADAAYYSAKSNMARSFALDDTDQNASLLTRDSEMSLNLVPFFYDQQGCKTLLDDEPMEGFADGPLFEHINLNSVNVPASWSRPEGRLPAMDEKGLIWLELTKNGNSWGTQYGSIKYIYNSYTGFQRHINTEEESS